MCGISGGHGAGVTGGCELGAAALDSGPLEEQYPLLAIVISPAPLLKGVPFSFPRGCVSET